MSTTSNIRFVVCYPIRSVLVLVPQSGRELTSLIPSSLGINKTLEVTSVVHLQTWYRTVRTLDLGISSTSGSVSPSSLCLTEERGGSGGSHGLTGLGWVLVTGPLRRQRDIVTVSSPSHSTLGSCHRGSGQVLRYFNDTLNFCCSIFS